jgi:hypothetical protein
LRARQRESKRSHGDPGTSWAGLARARMSLVNTARSLTKSYGERLRGCNVRNVNPGKAEGLSRELQSALERGIAIQAPEVGNVLGTAVRLKDRQRRALEDD